MILRICPRVLLVAVGMILCSSTGIAADPPSAAGSLITLLKSGRVPEARQSTLIKLICERGNEHDLRFIFDSVMKEDGWPLELRQQALSGLLEAATTRDVRPDGDLSEVIALISSDDLTIARLGVELCGQWKVDAAFPVFAKQIQSEELSIEQKRLRIEALARISPQESIALLADLASEEHSFEIRSMAIRALAGISLPEAGRLAGQTLLDADGSCDLGEILDGFLERDGGAEVLASVIQESPPSEDVAKLALRHLYSVGRTDRQLNDVLSEISGISEEPALPTPEELAELVRVVEQTGDPYRGEAVFRRDDLSCMKCHAVNQAGGQIGPDLSAVGSSSPIEYLLMSVLDPDQSIKEAYTTKVVVTKSGKIHQGLVDNRNSTTLFLKQATGQIDAIPVDDIDEEVEGKSLMPKGLVKFMTHSELIDLVKFLSELGKPGDFAVRSSPRIQRWKLLKDPPEQLINEIPSLSAFEDLVLNSDSWTSVYSRVNGDLPIDELTRLTGEKVIYPQGEIVVSKGGLLTGELNSSDGVSVWVGTQLMKDGTEFSWEAEEGKTPITLRIDSSATTSEVIRLELRRPDRSAVEFNVVDGQ
ncbi:hypothetical protein KOR42_08210 [Thalassoglobus neptunius]|uniref:Cytochrome c domain-containing protein n=1 Tax=Thalassoglobus neptunius TaxID=1938619 RepID=A0A5C5X3M0_9PLAN|nr:hypothetical protein [Thalassoglobus neptunius]TWT57460.1 hypothetical protein KOR42_08210 [Thalassoglobus neptunius]